MRRFVVVCEGPTDFRYASELADRLFKKSHEWLDDDLLEYHRGWCGVEAAFNYIKWDQVERLLTLHRLPKPYGFFGGEPGEPDAALVRQAMFLIVHRFNKEPIDGVMLLRDGDKWTKSRAKGISQAVNEPWVPNKQTIISAVVHTKIECWILAGFVPKANTEESSRLELLRQKLGFSPVETPHLLTANDEGKKSAKDALQELTNDDIERQRECWKVTELKILETNGGESGLAKFMDDIVTHWCPLLAK